MANTKIDLSELEYLKSCRDKLRDIAIVLDTGKDKEEKIPAEEKLRETKGILKGDEK